MPDQKLRKNPTIKDIARLAGTSHATVSRVLNHAEHPVRPELRERVLCAAHACNYTPNLMSRMLRNKAPGDIGVIVPNLTNPFYAAVLSELEELLVDDERNLFIASTHRKPNRERAIMKQMLMKRVSAVILLTELDDKETMKVAEQGGVLLVTVNQSANGMRGLHILLDGEYAAKSAVDYLYALGHENIGLISAPLNKQSRRMFYEGFMSAMEKNGLLGVCEIAGCEEEHSDELYEYEAGERLVKALYKRHPELTAVVACNDMMAIGAVKAIKAMNLCVPEDIAVIGRDDIATGQMIVPELTTISEPVGELGECICRWLESQLTAEKAGEDCQQITLRGKLIVRASTGAIRK